VLPSLFILIALSWVYLSFGDVPAVAGILYGIKPAATAIVVFAAYRIGARALRNALLWTVAAAAFVAIFALRIPFPWIVLAAGVVGIVGGWAAPDWFRAGGAHGVGGKDYGSAVIGDDTPTPAHARFRPWRAVMVATVGLSLAVLPLAALAWSDGWSGTLTQMGWFSPRRRC
jgi:chromate transporter